MQIKASEDLQPMEIAKSNQASLHCVNNFLIHWHAFTNNEQVDLDSLLLINRQRHVHGRDKGEGEVWVPKQAVPCPWFGGRTCRHCI